MMKTADLISLSNVFYNFKRRFLYLKKNILKPVLGIVFLSLLSIFFSCKSSGDSSDGEDSGSIKPVANLKVVSTKYANELQVSWSNPADDKLAKVEIVYVYEGPVSTKSYSSSKQTVEAKSGDQSSILLKVPNYCVYKVSITAIGSNNERSTVVSASASPCNPSEAIGADNLFIGRADTLMTSLMSYYFGLSSRDCWDNSYPRGTGYWDDDATVWGQGAGLAGFVALREASIGITNMEKKYTNMTDRMFNSINRFITTDNGINAYACYPANGNDRFYDDNVWIGLSMIDLYDQTKDTRFLEKAKMVWTYMMKGYDNTCGGGINWKELNTPSTSKNTCSTAPTAILGCKLYNATKESTYLDTAKELYVWLQKYLQDPSDYLYWDNIAPGMVVDKSKYPYNSGTPMQAACLLYKITNNSQYLVDAQNIARSAYKKWFTSFYSSALNETFNILTPGHVWFQSVMLRGYVELYKLDKDRTYITAYEKTLSNAWLSACRNKTTNLLNGDFRGITSQIKWEILHEGACLEMMARIASLKRDGL